MAEQFHDHYSPDHPVRYEPRGNDPDLWMTVEDAAKRIHRVIAEYRTVQEIMDGLVAGETFRGMFATYRIDPS